jgi:hypothetical protein
MARKAKIDRGTGPLDKLDEISLGPRAAIPHHHAIPEPRGAPTLIPSAIAPNDRFALSPEPPTPRVVT